MKLTWNSPIAPEGNKKETKKRRISSRSNINHQEIPGYANKNCSQSLPEEIQVICLTCHTFKIKSLIKLYLTKFFICMSKIYEMFLIISEYEMPMTMIS